MSWRGYAILLQMRADGQAFYRLAEVTASLVSGSHLDELDYDDDDREQDVSADGEQSDPARQAESRPFQRVQARGAPRDPALPQQRAPFGAVHPGRAAGAVRGETGRRTAGRP